MLNSKKRMRNYMKEDYIDLFSNELIIMFEKGLKIEYACIINKDKKDYIEYNIRALRKNISGYEIKYYFEECVEYDKKTCKEKHNHPIIFNCSIELLGNRFSKLVLKYKLDFMLMFVKYLENYSKDGQAYVKLTTSFETDKDLEKDLDNYTSELGYVKNITFPTQYAKFSPNIIITCDKEIVEFICNCKITNKDTTEKVLDTFVQFMKFNNDFIERHLK